MNFNKTCDVFVSLAIAYFSGHLLHIVLPLAVAIVGAALIGLIIFSVIRFKPNI